MDIWDIGIILINSYREAQTEFSAEGIIYTEANRTHNLKPQVERRAGVVSNIISSVSQQEYSTRRIIAQTRTRCFGAGEILGVMAEVSSPLTVLFFYAGGFYLMESASYQRTTQKLAQLTQARCLSVRYQLMPQNPFPAALLDGLVCYSKVLKLLYPLPGSFLASIDAAHHQ